MKTVLKVAVALLAVLALAVVGVYVWASVASNRVMSQTLEAHTVDFPVPFPPGADDIPEPDAFETETREIAMARAVERGRHLVASRYVCTECHGATFGGGVMVDAFPIGRILGPNITTGQGSRTLNYTPADWDRIVRHGILPDGRPAAMPSEDFQLMSDQELADIVAYVRSLPPVDNEVPPPSLGPLGKFLVATGELPLSATLITSHHSPHPEYPPPTEASVEFGRHVAGVCTGCHRQNFSGGPIVGGDPSWVPARNLTPHSDALGGWTLEQFTRALREGVRPDGTAVGMPMSLVAPYAQRMSDVEVEAIWMYLQSLPPVASAAAP
jgi:mono/diheme cytochrome c family protein